MEKVIEFLSQKGGFFVPIEMTAQIQGEEERVFTQTVVTPAAGLGERLYLISLMPAGPGPSSINIQLMDSVGHYDFHLGVVFQKKQQDEGNYHDIAEIEWRDTKRVPTDDTGYKIPCPCFSTLDMADSGATYRLKIINHSQGVVGLMNCALVALPLGLFG